MSTDARIFEQGYRRYGGQRGGTGLAIRSVAVHTARRLLGLRRSFWWKLVPLFMIGAAFTPAIVFIGIAALLPEVLSGDILPVTAGYYGFITVAVTAFVFLVSPQALCPDRRYRTLGLYLASPLTRDTYLVGKFIAIVGTLLVVTVLPPLLLTVAYALLGVGPSSAGDIALVLLRVLASGLVMSTMFATFGLAVSSFTDRVPFAAAAMVLLTTILALAGNLLPELDFPDEVRLVSIGSLPFELVTRIYGESESTTVSTPALVAGCAAWVLGCAALTRWRYQRLQVVR